MSCPSMPANNVIRNGYLLRIFIITLPGSSSQPRSSSHWKKAFQHFINIYSKVRKRIFRVAKVSRHNANLRILVRYDWIFFFLFEANIYRTIMSSMHEIAFLTTLLSLSILIFSTVGKIYYLSVHNLKSFSLFGRT